ncbi:ArgE/DapE family deacylase [Natronococcus occultus]|uniref:Acetylornithine deacetylase or succinyl-diaminopimelate desuccinylase n=1 Tax=Natronococcus occultus SP4 TaxID=694430 RepID=L0JUX4_9EURY|nr:ArgE/DapE family deacylase [Natronococcus occultus]AGB35904.1 acetylornithine deacetylase or succinyl-diaminopimelate desuccinylase [Natronococcus occultus SP4]
MDFATAWDADLRSFADELCRFETTAGNEAPAQEWLHERLAEWGFETYRWEADAETLAAHPSFPSDPAEIETADRPSVAGVLEFGDPDAGRTLVLNGHVDVVPAGSGWEGDPFEPRRADGRLTARGAADMKCGLAACLFAARQLEDVDPNVDGRIVVESVAGEEEGGIGAAAAARSNPYPFSRDAAIVGEPTDRRPVVATEGSLMKRLRLAGRSAHAATRWRGESVLPAFERVRQALEELEAERAELVSHPLYEAFPIPWPICIGRLEAGRWASSVADELTAEIRVGVAPGETVDVVEREVDRRITEAVAETDVDCECERFSIQFEPAEIEPDEPVVRAVQSAMTARGHERTDPRGVTYGADSRHYVAAGIPTVLFGPGSVEQAHFPEETIAWDDVLEAGETLATAAEAYLAN